MLYIRSGMFETLPTYANNFRTSPPSHTVQKSLGIISNSGGDNAKEISGLFDLSNWICQKR